MKRCLLRSGDESRVVMPLLLNMVSNVWEILLTQRHLNWNGAQTVRTCEYLPLIHICWLSDKHVLFSLSFPLKIPIGININKNRKKFVGLHRTQRPRHALIHNKPSECRFHVYMGPGLATAGPADVLASNVAKPSWKTELTKQEWFCEHF